MLALVYRESGGPVTLEDVAEPSCPADGVVVGVAVTGLCRSDWHAWRGHEVVALPHVGGHEFAGTVTAVGDEVVGFSVGERVTAPFVLGCGRCEFCRAGEAQVCPFQEQPGFSLRGSFAERVAVPHAATNLVRLPDAVSFAAAAALGCRFATAYRAVVTHGRLRSGQRVAVFGCGGVGLSAVMIAKALGAEVIAVDRSVAALALAEELGADAVVEATPGADLAMAIRARNVDGVHVGIDALGHPDLVAASVGALRRRGRHVQVGLLHGPAAQPRIPLDRVIYHELTLVGSHGMPAVDYPELLDLIVAGRVHPARLVTRRLGLDAAAAALTGMDRPTGPGITVIEPGGPIDPD